MPQKINLVYLVYFFSKQVWWIKTISFEILVITETKLDDMFSTSQFLVDSFSETLDLTETEILVV